MHYIQIGRNAMVLLILVITFQSCDWLTYSTRGVPLSIENTTSDTLVINLLSFNFGDYVYFRDTMDVSDHILYPGKITKLAENVTIGEDDHDGPIQNLFSQFREYDTCCIYLYDNDLRKIVENGIDTQNIVPNPVSLRILWKGPFSDMGDSVNNFFNKQSWRSEGEYEILFTISENDYNVKK
jgi:hypothetical protein